MILAGVPEAKEATSVRAQRPSFGIVTLLMGLWWQLTRELPSLVGCRKYLKECWEEEKGCTLCPTHTHIHLVMFINCRMVNFTAQIVNTLTGYTCIDPWILHIQFKLTYISTWTRSHKDTHTRLFPLKLYKWLFRLTLWSPYIPAFFWTDSQS